MLFGGDRGEGDCFLLRQVRQVGMKQVYEFAPLCRSRAVRHVDGRLIFNPQGCRFGLRDVYILEYAQIQVVCFAAAVAAMYCASQVDRSVKFSLRDP